MLRRGHPINGPYHIAYYRDRWRYRCLTAKVVSSQKSPLHTDPVLTIQILKKISIASKALASFRQTHALRCQRLQPTVNMFYFTVATQTT